MSDEQLDTIIEKLDKIIEQLMLGGTANPGTVNTTFEAPFDVSVGATRETLEMRDTDKWMPVPAPPEPRDDVARWDIPGGQTRVLQVTKRDGVVIDVCVQA